MLLALMPTGPPLLLVVMSDGHPCTAWTSQVTKQCRNHCCPLGNSNHGMKSATHTTFKLQQNSKTTLYPPYPTLYLQRRRHLAATGACCTAACLSLRQLPLARRHQPCLPPICCDPFYLLRFTNAFSSNSFLGAKSRVYAALSLCGRTFHSALIGS